MRFFQRMLPLDTNRESDRFYEYDPSEGYISYIQGQYEFMLFPTKPLDVVTDPTNQRMFFSLSGGRILVLYLHGKDRG